jgi:hypothetical protein
MFGALLAHLQEALHKRHLVYCMRMSVGCGTVATATVPQPTDILTDSKHVEALDSQQI